MELLDTSFKTISLAKTKDDIAINSLIKLFPKKYYRRYILKNIPVKFETIEYINEQGLNIILPITQEELNIYDQEYLTDIISKVVDKYNVDYSEIPEMLRGYVNYEEVSANSLIKYMMFDKILDKALYMKGITLKNLRPIIIDSGNEKTKYILDLLIDKLNYLTIVTHRKEYFEEFRENIYYDTGLLVDIVDNPLKTKVDGNLIIDLNKKLYKNYNYYQKNIIVIDLEADNDKLKNIVAKRKDLTIIYDVLVYARGEVANNELLSIIICNQDENIEDFYKEGINNYIIENFIDTTKNYDIRLKELKILNR